MVGTFLDKLWYKGMCNVSFIPGARTHGPVCPGMRWPSPFPVWPPQWRHDYDPYRSSPVLLSGDPETKKSIKYKQDTSFSLLSEKHCALSTHMNIMSMHRLVTRATEHQIIHHLQRRNTFKLNVFDYFFLCGTKYTFLKGILATLFNIMQF